jgi:hypothetical protein
LCPSDRRLSAPQSWSGCCRKVKDLLPLPEINPDSPALQPAIHRFTDWAIPVPDAVYNAL